MAFHDSDPRNDDEPNFELSQGELESLQRSLAYYLILNGELEDNPGSRIPEGSTEASRFMLSIPKSVIKQIFCPGETDVWVKSGSLITYEPPHHNPDDDAVYENVDLRYEVQLADTPITRVTYMLLQNKNGVYSGEITTEYFNLDEPITPINVSLDHIEALTDEQVAEIEKRVQDIRALQAPLSFKDAQNLRLLSMAMPQS